MRKKASQITFEARLDAIAAKRDAMDAKIESRKARVEVIEVREMLREILKTSRMQPSAASSKKDMARILDIKTVDKEQKKPMARKRKLPATPQKRKSIQKRTVRKKQSVKTPSRPAKQEANILEKILFGRNIYR